MVIFISMVFVLTNALLLNTLFQILLHKLVFRAQIRYKVVYIARTLQIAHYACCRIFYLKVYVFSTAPILIFSLRLVRNALNAHL